jgi:hypothetical protein
MTTASIGSFALDALLDTLVLRRIPIAVPAGNSAALAQHTTHRRGSTVFIMLHLYYRLVRPLC